jgi:hypothetical protein
MEIQEQRREFSFWWWGIGTFVAALSLTSFIQKVSGVGLAPVLGECLSYYRMIAHSPFRLVDFWVTLPEWYKDAYALSFIALVAFLRGDVATGRVRVEGTFSRAVTSVLFPLLLSIPLAGLATVILSVSLLIEPESKLGTDVARVRSAVASSRHQILSLACAVIAAAGFFALNAQW